MKSLSTECETEVSGEMGKAANDSLPRTRAEAKDIGAKKYFTGAPCKHGHVAARSTATGYCCECNRIRLVEYSLVNREEINRRARERYDPLAGAERNKKYREENAQILSEKRKERYYADTEREREEALAYYHENKEDINARKRKKRAENGDEIRAEARRKYAENPEKAREYLRKWRADNKDTINEAARKKRAEDPEKSREYHREYRAKNIDREREYDREQARKRYADPKEKLNRSVREMVRGGIIRGSKNNRRTFALLGYTVQELMSHLERLFQPGMTWENYGRGGWHVDHVVPLAAHNFETPDDLDFKRAWALSNLQPLWEPDNIRKHAKLEKPFQPSLALAIPANDNKPHQ